MTKSTPETSSGTVEVAELVDFLSATPPFSRLSDERIRHVARRLDITYARSGTVVLDIDEETGVLYLVRTGAVELRDESDTLVARLGEREYFGYPALLTDAPASRKVKTIEDTLLYLIPEEVFDACRAESEAFDGFFARAHADRVRDALQQEHQNVPFTQTVRSMISRSPVCAPPDASIQSAAQKMRDARVSSVLITESDRLVGLVTDRDLRNRVVAESVRVSEPVSSVMTHDPWTIDADALAFEALLSMSRHNVHHLPVVDGESLAGMVTSTDLMRLQGDSPVYLVGEVWKQSTVDGLVEVSERIPAVLQHVIDTGARADDATRVVTAVTDAITERLIEMAVDEMGPPPVDFAWLALGSQARHEQTAHSDQDNALLLANAFDPEAHDAYFVDLATFVCDGLDACGYEYCPGEVMATTDRWRQPLSSWKKTFAGWIREPHPKSVMHSTIFFDMRHVAGSETLTRRLKSFFLDETKRNTIFLASLTANALDNEPPLGFFRQFVLETHGDHADTLDLKHNGVVPIIDLARIYALGAGVDAVNTLRRLSDLADAGGMNAADAADLRDAHEFIASVRLQHQADQIRRGAEPNNYVSPDRLSDFDRRHLKDAFKIVSRMQSAMAQRYQTNFIT